MDNRTIGQVRANETKLIHEIDALETKLKKQQEIINKAVEYIAICLRDSEENENYPINKNDLNNLLSILKDKEV